MSQKVTYQLDEETVRQVRAAVESGSARNMSEFVEDALRGKLEEMAREEIRAEIRRAADDPLFRADVAEISREFEPIDWEDNPEGG